MERAVRLHDRRERPHRRRPHAVLQPQFRRGREPADADGRADDARREPGHRARDGDRDRHTCDEFNATIYEEAIADALGTEDADYSDAACSDAGRRRLADGEDDTVEIYSEVTIPGRAVPSGFNAQRYLMKQLQPERFQTRIHRTAARRGACGRRAPTNPANPCYNKTRGGGRRPPPGGQRRLMGDLTIIEVTTSTFAPTAAPTVEEDDDDDKGVNAAAGGAIGAGCAIVVVVALAVWYEASRRGGAKQQTAEPLKDLTPVAVEDPVVPGRRPGGTSGSPRQSGPQPAVAACDFPDPESDCGVCGAI